MSLCLPVIWGENASMSGVIKWACISGTIVAAIACVALAYRWAEPRYLAKESGSIAANSYRPLYYGMEAMAQPAIREKLEMMERTRRWYQCLGQAQVTVLLWTLL